MMRIRDRIAWALYALSGKQLPVVQQVQSGSEFPIVPLDNYVEHQIAYQVHPWVHACVRVLATNAAQAQLGIYRRRMFTDEMVGPLEIKEPVPRHPLTQLFRSPNPTMGISSYGFINNMVGYLELDGNFYGYLQRDASTQMTQMIIPLRPDRVTPVPSKTRHIEGYIYRIDGESYAIDASDIFHVKYMNPYNDHLGLSTLSAARLTLEEDVFAQKHNTNFYKNGARPGGAISFDQQLNDDDFKRVRQEWEKAHRGVDNAHRVAIFERGAKWQSLGMTPVEADFIEAQKMSREKISSVFGVPPVLVNSYDSANYNTAKTQAQIFWRITIQPKLTLIAESINVQLYKLLGPTRIAVETEDIFAGWDTAMVWALQEEMREGVESSVKLVNNGLMNRNEVRAKQYNLPPVEGGENFFRPAGQSPITEVGAGPADQPPGDNEEPEQPDADGNEEENEEDNAAGIKEIQSPEERDQLWKALMVTTEFLEKIVARYVRALFEDQRKETIARLRAFDDRSASIKARPTSEIEIEAVLFDLERAKEVVEETATPMHRRIMTEGGRHGIQMAGLSFAFDLDNPRARALLRAKVQTFAKKVNETTWKQLKDSLMDGMREGEGIAALATRVSNTMDVRGAKALEIARTETGGAYNGGLLESWNQAGPEVKGKEWLTAGDEHVRFSHESIDGTKIPLDNKFEVDEGPALDFPGDPAGAASEIINCRCALQPVLEEL